MTIATFALPPAAFSARVASESETPATVETMRRARDRSLSERVCRSTIRFS
jgi:hypothetical protein